MYRQPRASIVSVSPNHAAVSIRNVFTLVYYHRNNCPPFIMRISAGICEYADPTGTNAHATRRACAQTRDIHGGSFSHKPWRFTLSSGRIYPSANCCNLANVPCSPRVCVYVCACACVYSWKLLGNETMRIHHRLIPVDRLFLPSPLHIFPIIHNRMINEFVYKGTSVLGVLDVSSVVRRLSRSRNDGGGGKEEREGRVDKKVIGSGVESTRKLHEKKLNINETYTIYIYIEKERERKRTCWFL